MVDYMSLIELVKPVVLAGLMGALTAWVAFVRKPRKGETWDWKTALRTSGIAALVGLVSGLWGWYSGESVTVVYNLLVGFLGLPVQYLYDGLTSK